VFSASGAVCKDQSSVALKIRSLKIHRRSNFQLNLGRFHAIVQCPGYISSGVLHAYMVIHMERMAGGIKCESFLCKTVTCLS